jgi:hypothetical protein
LSDILDKSNDSDKQNSSNTNKKIPDYYRFSVAKYALSDVIEAIKNNGGKEIAVTKEDGELIVLYKPSWRA